MPHRLIKALAIVLAVLATFAAWKGLNALLGSTPVPKAEYFLGENTMVEKIHKSDAEWRAVLTPEQYKVLRQSGTEPAFTGVFNNHYEPGIYRCAACGTPLFGSQTKYDHGTGWPSFTSSLDKNNLEFREDRSLFMKRIEVRCAVCGSHLGHVFNDGPAPSFEHYCINSAALDFTPMEKADEAADRQKSAGITASADASAGQGNGKRPERDSGGSGEAAPASEGPATPAPADKSRSRVAAGPNNPQTATFAAGCFWGVEYKFGQIKGVISTEVGYTGGTTPNPTYNQVCTDRTGHAEAVRVVFEPDVVSYEELVRQFFSLHDPTQVNRQGPDVGTQYRSVIFYHNEEQKETARKIIQELDASGAFKKPIATGIVPASEYTRAEEYHQKYYQKHKKGACLV